MRLLILEDDPKDALLAAETARAEGFEEIEEFTALRPAIERFEQTIRDEKSVPEAFLADLDLGSDSGYELLRLLHKTGRTEIHVVVWSYLEERNRERSFQGGRLRKQVGGPSRVARRSQTGELRETMKPCKLPNNLRQRNPRRWQDCGF
jgi:CheY-like chemotaxis protein